MDSTASPTDTGHRFAAIGADDASGYLWISSILCLIYCALVLFVRLHIKWKLYGADDYTAAAATVLQLGETIPLFMAMKKGLGRSEHLLGESQLQEIGKATFAAQVFFILSLATAKASVVALMLRLFTRDIKVTRKSWILCNATLALTIVWGIGSIVAISVSCSPPDLVQLSAARQCSGQLTRWRIIAAVDIFIDIVLVLLPILFIWPIQMKRYIKLQVALAFGFRLPVIAFAATHLYFVADYTNSTNVSKAIIPALVYQQFQLSWSLLSATIPTLKAFMRSFNSGFGMEIDLDGPYGYGSGGGYNSSGAYPLESLQNATAPNGTVISRPGVKARQKGSGKHSATTTTETGTVESGPTTYHPDRRSSNVDSEGSQEMIIKREVQWSVLHENVKL